MRCIFSTLVVALLIFHSPRVHSEDAEVTIFNQWPRGFYGEISIALEDDVEDGWQLTVSFFVEACKTPLSMECKGGFNFWRQEAVHPEK